MAAGRGMRMMPLTDHVPKPLVKFKDSTLIANAIGQLKNKVPNIAITVGYKGAELSHYVIGQGVSAVFNTQHKGNAWWLFNTQMRFINEPVLVLTCDNVVDLDIGFLGEQYRRLHQPPCMVVPVQPVPGIDGDYIFERRDRVTELSRRKVSDRYCSGIQVVNPFVINQLIPPTEDFYEVWSGLIALEKLYCSARYLKAWYGVDTLEQLEAVKKIKFEHNSAEAFG